MVRNIFAGIGAVGALALISFVSYINGMDDANLGEERRSSFANFVYRYAKQAREDVDNDTL